MFSESAASVIFMLLAATALAGCTSAEKRRQSCLFEEKFSRKPLQLIDESFKKKNVALFAVASKTTLSKVEPTESEIRNLSSSLNRIPVNLKPTTILNISGDIRFSIISLLWHSTNKGLRIAPGDLAILWDYEQCIRSDKCSPKFSVLAENISLQKHNGRTLYFQLVDGKTGTPYIFELVDLIYNQASTAYKSECLFDVIKSSNSISIASDNSDDTYRPWITGSSAINQFPRYLSLIFETLFLKSSIKPSNFSAKVVVLIDNGEPKYEADKKSTLDITITNLMRESVSQLAGTIYRIFSHSTEKL